MDTSRTRDRGCQQQYEQPNLSITTQKFDTSVKKKTPQICCTLNTYLSLSLPIVKNAFYYFNVILSSKNGNQLVPIYGKQTRQNARNNINNQILTLQFQNLKPTRKKKNYPFNLSKTCISLLQQHTKQLRNRNKTIPYKQSNFNITTLETCNQREKMISLQNIVHSKCQKHAFYHFSKYNNKQKKRNTLEASIKVQKLLSKGIEQNIDDKKKKS